MGAPPANPNFARARRLVLKGASRHGCRNSTRPCLQGEEVVAAVVVAVAVGEVLWQKMIWTFMKPLHLLPRALFLIKRTILSSLRSNLVFPAAEHVSNTLLNPKINHRSDAIFGDQALHRISRRGRERENWEETHHEYIQEWEARRQRIFPESEQYDPSSYEEYLHWYSGVTRRYLVPSISDDVEAGPSLQPDDSIDLQYQAKAPMIRKAVDKLHGMVKKAKMAMTSTADTTTQALVFEFLHGFQDVLHDLGEIKENGGSATSPHVESAAAQDMPLLLLEAEQNIVHADQEAQHQEEEELHMVDDATMTLEPMDEEDNGFNNVICPCPSLELEEHSHSATPAIDECDTATPAPGSAIPQQSTSVDQDGHLENPNEMGQIELMVEPMYVDHNDSNNVLSSSTSAQALLENCEVAEAVNENVDPATQVTGSSTPEQGTDVIVDAEQENPATTEGN
uniref:PI-PLC Y-box domain-containing protein n=1 Tax=Oryza nivara TaxID=4536 RepID=A0A0E0FSV1_ORYNI